MWSAAVAFVLAAAGSFFVSYGLTIGFLVGAAVLFGCAHNLERLARVELAWPLVMAEKPPLRGHWDVFRFTTIAALALAAVVSLFSATAIYIFELRNDLAISEGRQQIRHLTANQKDRIRNEMTVGLNEKYELQVNSLPSCDECDQFADEIRTFINTIPGWTAGGGPLMWPGPEELHRGLWLLADDQDQRKSPALKVNNAFADAGLRLQQSSGGIHPGFFVILVARPK
jgi:hypothetical protein